MLGTTARRVGVSGSMSARRPKPEPAAMVTATFPGFVFVCPKWEHKSCSDSGMWSSDADPLLYKAWRFLKGGRKTKKE